MRARIKVIAATGRWDFDAQKSKGVLARAYKLGLNLFRLNNYLIVV